jgi:hypothetical protein
MAANSEAVKRHIRLSTDRFRPSFTDLTVISHAFNGPKGREWTWCLFTWQEIKTKLE